MRTSLTRAGVTVAAAASLALGLSACGSDSADGGGSTPVTGEAVAVLEETSAGSQPPSGVDGDPTPTIDAGQGEDGGQGAVDAGQGDYVFGLDRDSIAQTVTETFASQNAASAWEGDTLVVTMDGDAEGPLAGWNECRAVTELVEEGDSVAFAFPNGRIECDEVLEP